MYSSGERTICAAVKAAGRSVEADGIQCVIVMVSRSTGVRGYTNFLIGVGANW